MFKAHACLLQNLINKECTEILVISEYNNENIKAVGLKRTMSLNIKKQVNTLP